MEIKCSHEEITEDLRGSKMTEQTYIKNDLIDYADESKIEQAGNYDIGASSRMGALQHVLPDEAEFHVESVGSYDGESVYIIELDGYIWMAHTFYGTCSYCDSFLADPVATTESLLRKAYCFTTIDDAIRYIETTDDFGYYGTGLVEPARDTLKKIGLSR